MRTLAVAAVVVPIAIGVGFLAGIAMISLLGVVLPPFREEVDDDTMREFIPVALAYLAWAATTVVVLALAVRRYLRAN